MKILIMGATGRTGKRIVSVALQRGHQVVAIARDPSKLDGLKAEIIEGTPYNPSTLARAMKGCDAVVNVLNVSRKSDNPWGPLVAPPDLISKSCANALAAMKDEGVTRYVALSTVGASETRKSIPLLLELIVRHSNLKIAFEDHTAQETLLRQSDLDYTIARAPMLTNKDGASKVLVTRPGEKMNRSIGRHAVAAFIVSILEDGAYKREIIHISERSRP